MYCLVNECCFLVSLKIVFFIMSFVSFDVLFVVKMDGVEIVENSMQISEFFIVNDDIDQLLVGVIGLFWMYLMEWNDMQIDICSGDEFLNLFYYNFLILLLVCFIGF